MAELLSYNAVTIIVILGLIYVSICLILFLRQDAIIFARSAPPTDTQLPTDILPRLAQHWLKHENGDKLEAWWIPACEHSTWVWVYCHGNMHHLREEVETLSLLQQLDVNILAFDYRGFGLSTGTPNEERCNADLDLVIDHLAQQGFAPSRIILHGRSLGGGIVGQALDRYNPGAVVLESTFGDCLRLAKEEYPYLPIKLLCKCTLGAAKTLPTYAGPSLILHSINDQRMPIAHVEQLAQTGQRTTFIPICGNHHDAYLHPQSHYLQHLEDFLSDTLKQAPSDD